MKELRSRLKILKIIWGFLFLILCPLLIWLVFEFELRPFKFIITDFILLAFVAVLVRSTEKQINEYDSP